MWREVVRGRGEWMGRGSSSDNGGYGCSGGSCVLVGHGDGVGWWVVIVCWLVLVVPVVAVEETDW